MHLIVFADYGLDDAAATVSLFRREGRFDRIDLVPIGGNVPTTVSFGNCMTLLSEFPEILQKIRVVDTRHLSQPEEYLASIHGGDGMGDLLAPATVEAEEILFEDWLEELTGTETVLSLGPMTLVQRVMERHAHPLVVMGGCVDTPPNYHGYEFNHGLDPAAFAFCAPKAKGVITLDTCRVPSLDMRNHSLAGEDLHTAILRRDVELSYSRGEDGCYVWDDVAACFVLYPQRFTLAQKTDPYGNTYQQAVFCAEGLYFAE